MKERKGNHRRYEDKERLLAESGPET